MSFAHSRCVLSLTSAGILVPLLTAHAHQKHVLVLFLSVTLAASTLHWWLYDGRSWLREADRLASLCSLLCAAWHAPAALLTAPLLLLLLKVGRDCLARQAYWRHLCVHLCFRYLAFWVCCYGAGMQVNTERVLFYTWMYAVGVAGVSCTHWVAVRCAPVLAFS